MRSNLFAVIAVILLGGFLIAQSQTAISSTLELIWGIVVVALGLASMFGLEEKVKA